MSAADIVRRYFASIYRGQPKTPSGKWEMWQAMLSPTTCSLCLDNHGKILYDTWPQTLLIAPPVHVNCRCKIVLLPAISLGTVTIYGNDGADMWITLYNNLPSEYVSKNKARSNGWISKLGNLWDVIPNAVIGGDIYKNINGKLPSLPGRIWYEADINYVGGFRGTARILYSSDGLLFVTYDHYFSFMEIY